MLQRRPQSLALIVRVKQIHVQLCIKLTCIHITSQFKVFAVSLKMNTAAKQAAGHHARFRCLYHYANCVLRPNYLLYTTRYPVE